MNARNEILSLLTRQDGCTIPQAAEALDLSVGTVTKHIITLVNEGYLEDLGTAESASGRRPHVYSLRAGAGHFLGLDVSDRYVNIGLMDFRGGMHRTKMLENYVLDAPDSFERLCNILKKAVAIASEKGFHILGCCVSLPGRIDNASGVSFTNFYLPGKPLAARLQKQVNFPLCIYNDTRAMTYGEFLKGAGSGTRNMLMLNVNWGLGLGIVIDGKVYCGKSGYAGEFGHVYGFDNQVLCRCGKRGCNETEISGQALRRHLTKRIKDGDISILSPHVLGSDKPLTLDEIMDAVAREDVLCIEVLEQIGLNLGVRASGLINLFNPERIVVGGELARTGDYLLNPMRMAVNKHAIHLVSQDTDIVPSTLGMDAGIVGSCMVARSRHIGERFEC